jgi:hypothetical protein
VNAALYDALLLERSTAWSSGEGQGPGANVRIGLIGCLIAAREPDRRQKDDEAHAILHAVGVHE